MNQHLQADKDAEWFQVLGASSSLVLLIGESGPNFSTFLSSRGPSATRISALLQAYCGRLLCRFVAFDNVLTDLSKHTDSAASQDAVDSTWLLDICMCDSHKPNMVKNKPAPRKPDDPEEWAWMPLEAPCPEQAECRDCQARWQRAHAYLTLPLTLFDIVASGCAPKTTDEDEVKPLYHIAPMGEGGRARAAWFLRGKSKCGWKQVPCEVPHPGVFGHEQTDVACRKFLAQVARFVNFLRQTVPRPRGKSGKPPKNKLPELAEIGEWSPCLLLLLIRCIDFLLH